MPPLCKQSTQPLIIFPEINHPILIYPAVIIGSLVEPLCHNFIFNDAVCRGNFAEQNDHFDQSRVIGENPLTGLVELFQSGNFISYDIDAMPLTNKKDKNCNAHIFVPIACSAPDGRG